MRFSTFRTEEWSHRPPRGVATFLLFSSAAIFASDKPLPFNSVMVGLAAPLVGVPPPDTGALELRRRDGLALRHAPSQLSVRPWCAPRLDRPPIRLPSPSW